MENTLQGTVQSVVQKADVKSSPETSWSIWSWCDTKETEQLSHTWAADSNTCRSSILTSDTQRLIFCPKTFNVFSIFYKRSSFVRSQGSVVTECFSTLRDQNNGWDSCLEMHWLRSYWPKKCCVAKLWWSINELYFCLISTFILASWKPLCRSLQVSENLAKKLGLGLVKRRPAVHFMVHSLQSTSWPMAMVP